jgi:hypothetical protein
MKGEIILCQTENGQTKIEVVLDNETVWLDQYQMAELFQTDRTSILRHIRNIYKTGELEEKSTSKYFQRTQLEGERKVTRNIICYNFDLLTSLGFKINSNRGIIFRKKMNSYFRVSSHMSKDFSALFNEMFDFSRNTFDKAYLYLMYEASTGFYKIGASKNPNSRERTLQSQKPDIKLLYNTRFTKKKAFSIEQKLHRLFDMKRVRGEWFALTEEDLNTFFAKVIMWTNE